jgi:peptidoglycan/xylan/chitin deacetylase (PgdA/CDA1 family)
MTSPIPILLYHGVAPEGPEALAPFVLHPARFAEHMAVLADRGTTTLTVSALVDLLDRGEVPAPGTALVTFDDGLADFGEHAWPVLERFGIASTLYVVTGCVGGPAEWLRPFGDPVPDMLSWDQVLDLDGAGCEIGAHSRTHRELDTLAPPDLGDEVRTSRTVLSSRLGHPVRSFAYPHGYHGPTVVSAVQAAGYDSACAVRNLLSSTTDNRFALARYTVTADLSTDDLVRVLDGDLVGVAPRREQVRTRAWRTYRRAKTRVGAAR